MLIYIKFNLDDGNIKKTVYQHGQQLYDRLADLEEEAQARGMEIDKKASLKVLTQQKGLK